MANKHTLLGINKSVFPLLTQPDSTLPKTTTPISWETERDRERETERDGERKRETEREWERETERDWERKRETEREWERETEREWERQRQRETETDRETDRQTDRDRERDRQGQRELSHKAIIIFMAAITANLVLVCNGHSEGSLIFSNNWRQTFQIWNECKTTGSGIWERSVN